VEPNPDTNNATCVNNVLTGSIYQVDTNGTTYTVFLFQRLVTTYDKCDCPILNETQKCVQIIFFFNIFIVSQLSNLILENGNSLAWAYGQKGKNGFSDHGPNAGRFSMNFFQALSGNGTLVTTKDYTTWKM
jgi:hypothetical protein